MSELIIIAGPQAAGKSTLISRITEEYGHVSPLREHRSRRHPVILPLQESRQIIVHKEIILGAIFMTAEQEFEVIKCDLDRMDLILRRNEDHLIYLDECNIFTMAHAAAHGVTQGEKYWDAYVSRLEKLSAKVLFLNVDPSVSWERRIARYQQRLIYFPAEKHEIIMERYHAYINRLHALLLEVYQRLAFPKEMIDGNMPEGHVICAVSQALARVSGAFHLDEKGVESCLE